MAVNILYPVLNIYEQPYCLEQLSRLADLAMGYFNKHSKNHVGD
jgi:hypothetical protein